MHLSRRHFLKKRLCLTILTFSSALMKGPSSNIESVVTGAHKNVKKKTNQTNLYNSENLQEQQNLPKSIGMQCICVFATLVPARSSSRTSSPLDHPHDCVFPQSSWLLGPAGTTLHQPHLRCRAAGTAWAWSRLPCPWGRAEEEKENG